MFSFSLFVFCYVCCRLPILLQVIASGIPMSINLSSIAVTRRTDCVLLVLPVLIHLICICTCMVGNLI